MHRGFSLNVKGRLASLDANLNDLQSGVEACSRAADMLHGDAISFDRILKRLKDVPGIGSLAARVSELQTCLREQNGVLGELRDGLARLEEDLTRSNGAAKPKPRAEVADRSRR